jgi:uncharacterized protein (DUF1015 family)
MDASPVVTPPYVAGPLRLDAFRGLMLSPARVGDPASARAFARPYRDVVARLSRWESDGHVHHDAEPAVYLHEYTSGGLTVRGLVGALDLSRRAHRPEERVVLPHEGVHPTQAAELAARMTEMAMNPAPILLVHRGPEAVRAVVHQLLETPPAHEFTDRSEQRNRLWGVRDPATLAVVAEALAGCRALIADGHHRYAAYLRMQEDAPGTATDRGLAMLVDQDDTPLFLGAIHRVLTGCSLADVRDAAAGLGDYRVVTEGEALARLGPETLVLTDGRAWATLHLELGRAAAAVELLHASLIPALATPPTRVGHHHSVDEALAQLGRGRNVAVLMPSADFDLIRRIVAGDRLLPEKATSFQPKPSLGVLMRSLRDE